MGNSELICHLSVLPSDCSSSCIADAVRLCDADPQVLAGLKGTGLGVIISVQDSELKEVDQNQDVADLKTHVFAFYPGTRKTSIAVGNEILAPNSNTVRECGPYLLPAMWKLYHAFYDRGLQNDIKVVAPLRRDILGTSWPPAAGAFIQMNFVSPLLQFLQHTGSKFFINVYPFYAHKRNPVQVPFDYAVFSTTVPELVDPNTGLPYHKLLDAMIDAPISAMIKMGVTNVGVAVGETGWPTAGGFGASAETAALHTRNDFNAASSDHQGSRAAEL